MEKKCRKCKQILDISEFNPDRLGKYGVWSTCKSCLNAHKQTYKRINPVSAKKKERIKKEWSEWDLFIEIAIERAIDGYVLAEDVGWIMKKIKLQDLRVENFSHIKPKWMYPELRLNKDNIKIVTFAYHFYEHNKLNYKWPNLPN